MAEAHSEAVEIVLGDGTAVLLRPVGPEDRQRIRVGLTQMSPASRYLRFFTGNSELSEEQLRRMTEIDQRQHVAWGALDPTREGLPGLGLGRFVQLPQEPGVAELALAVIDRIQGRGLGRVLLGMLYLRAQELGVKCLRGLTLPENVAVSGWLRRLGARLRHADGIDIADLPIERDLSRLPSTSSARRLCGAMEDLQRAMNRR